MTHIVTAPLVSVKDPAGKLTYFYEGATVPDGFSRDDLERLSGLGMVKSTDPVEEASEAPEGDPSDAWTVKQLKAHAEAKGVDLGDAKSKADILSKLSE